MKTTRVLSKFIFLLFIFPLFLSSCAGIGEGLLQSPKLKVTNVKVTNLSFNNQSIIFTLDVDNPNPIPIPIKGLSYKLDLNGVEFASGFSENSISIPASGNGQMDLNIGGNLISFIQKVGGVSSSGIDYNISGDISLLSSSIRFPYSHGGKLSLGSLL